MAYANRQFPLILTLKTHPSIKEKHFISHLASNFTYSLRVIGYIFHSQDVINMILLN